MLDDLTSILFLKLKFIKKLKNKIYNLTCIWYYSIEYFLKVIFVWKYIKLFF